MDQKVGGAYVELGVDMSGFTQELLQAEQKASGSATRIKDRLLSIGTSLNDLRTQAKMVKESLAGAADFRVRGDSGLDKLHEQLAKVRATGQITDGTLDKLSLAFQENARGAHTYTQALDKIAANKNASDSVRQLATQLSNEAKEANYDVAALEKRQRVLDRMIGVQSRRFASLSRQATQGESAGGSSGTHGVPMQTAASGAVRLAEGQLSIRASERFLTGTLGLGGALQSIFPLIGAAATIGALGELVSRAANLYEEFKKLQEAPARINQEFGGLNQTLQMGNDQLRVSNDRLENEIATLEGKPQNGLKLALDEATQAADSLAQSLGRDIDQLQKLLEQEQVGSLKGFFTLTAPTTATVEANKKLQNDLVNIDIETAQKSRATEDPAAREAISRAGTEQRRARIEQEIKDAQKALDDAKARQAAIGEPRGPTVAVIAGVPIQANARGLQESETNNVTQLERRLDALLQIEPRFGLTQTNQDLTQKKAKLDASKSAADLTRPFADKMHELSAQIEAVNSSLAAVGKTDTAETLAKSWGAAQEAIAKLNNDLAKHHQSLTLGQQLDVLAAEDTLALSKADLEWKTKLDQTTTSIENRVAALKIQTAAIGKGAAAQREAFIQTKLMETLGSKFNDEEFKKTHQPDIKKLETGFGEDFDKQKASQLTQNLLKIHDQIDLEKSLAAVQRLGADAINTVTLAYRLRALAAQGATTAEIKAEIDLFNAKKANQSSASLANINQQIDATRRLSAAQLQGAEEYRQAQLDLKYQQMQREGASPQEIGQTRNLDALQHQQQVTADALRTAMSYRDQLEAVNEQIAAVDQLRAKFGDTRDLEISLKALEEQRTQILSQQALAVGSAKDGMVAFFREMATQSESAAQQVHDAFRSAFGGINDELSKLMTGQKTNWASFLQSLGAQISKMGLQGLEHTIAAKIQGTLGAAGQNAPGSPQAQAKGAGGVIATLGKIFGAGDNTLKRDGNTPATALFVTLAGANGIPQWSVASSSGAQDTSDFGITSSDLSQLENGGDSDVGPSPAKSTAALTTLRNGAAKLPGIGGEIASAGLKLLEALLSGHSSKSDSSGGSASSSSGSSTGTTSPSSGASGAPGAQSGDVLTRDPSGLIIRTPAPKPSDQPSMTTLYNGARPKPSVWGEIGEAGLKLFTAFLANSMSGGGSGGSGDDGGGEEVDSTISYDGPAFAKGGRPPVGKVSLVGEKGPELFIPDRPGTIIPNHKLSFRASGGNVDPGMAYVVGERGAEAFASFASAPDKSSRQPMQIVNYTIDARGTDAALVEQRTRAALASVHQSAIITSVQTSAERTRRQPQR